MNEVGWVGGGGPSRVALLRIAHAKALRFASTEVFVSLHVHSPDTIPQVGQTFVAGTSESAFKLSVLVSDHPSYSSLEEQFLSMWLKWANGLTVERIIKIEVRIA